jgi:hypothetical protein
MAAQQQQEEAFAQKEAAASAKEQAMTEATMKLVADVGAPFSDPTIRV